MTEPLRRLVAALPSLGELTGHVLVLVGGLSRGVWAEPRATADVDVLYAGSLEVLVDAAPSAGLAARADEVAALARAGMTRLRLPDMLQGATRLDVIHADHPFYQRVIARSRRAEIFGLEVRVAAPEDVVLLKLLADRPQDRADVTAILSAQGEALDRGLIHEEAVALELPLPAALR